MAAEQPDMSTNVVNITEDQGVTKEVLVKGSGSETPSNGSEVVVHYVGTLLDGTKFDSSRDRADPFNFELGKGKVIKGWDLGVATMTLGEKAILTCAADYAYGEEGSGAKIPGGATLKFEVELLSWSLPKVTSDGLITKDVRVEGKGWESPNDFATVTVKYSGTIKGKDTFVSMEERTHIIGEDDSLPSGLNTCLKKMKKGERTVFHISPGEHHFEADQLPNGVGAEDTLIYDVEMVDFKMAKDIWKMTPVEKLEFAEKCKAHGNKLFKGKRFSGAEKKYEKVVSILEKFSSASGSLSDTDSDLEEAGEDASSGSIDPKSPAGPSDEQKAAARTLLVAAYNNMANCQMRDERCEMALANCTKALEIEPDNQKAMFRRSKANFEVQDYAQAREDIKRALELDPENKLFKAHLNTVSRRIIDDQKKQRQMYQRMFAS
eukprot:23377_1